MPSGPKKRAKAKKRQQRLGLHDDPDSQSRSSDDKETDTCDSIEDPEEDLIPKSPLGKSAYSAGEDYKSQTEKWVRVSNFEVGLPTPRSESATVDFDQLMYDEPSGIKSPDWETVEGETLGSLDGGCVQEGPKGDGVLTLNHAVKPEELEAVLQSAERDYFSCGNRRKAEQSSKGDGEATSVGDSLAVEPGTEVADQSVGSGTVPCGSSLPDSEDQAECVTDVASSDSRLAAGALTESFGHSGEVAHPNLPPQHFKKRVEEDTSDVTLSNHFAETADAKSPVEGFGEQGLHQLVENVDHSELVDPKLSRLGSEDEVAEHLEAVGTSGDRVAELADQDSSSAELGGSFSAEPDVLTETVPDATETDEKSSAQACDEFVENQPEFVVDQGGDKVEEKDLYEPVESQIAGDGDESQTEDVEDASEIRDGLPLSSSYENVNGHSHKHAVAPSHEESLAAFSAVTPISLGTGVADASASRPSTADGEDVEEQVIPEVTNSAVNGEFPTDEAVDKASVTETNAESEVQRKDEVNHVDDLPLSSSFESVNGPPDTESSPAVGQGRTNGHHVEEQAPPSIAPSTGGKTLQLEPDLAEDHAIVEALRKLQTVQVADGTSLGGVTLLQSVAVSDLQPNNGVLIVDQVKDIRDRNSSGCCGVFYWIFGQAD